MDLTGISRKEDEKFNEFKKNLLEELKLLKEANNMMRDRNKNLNIGTKQKQPENRWLLEFFDKRNKRNNRAINELNSTTSLMRTKDFMKPEDNKRRMIDNFIERTKYDSIRNIYSNGNNIKVKSMNGSSEKSNFERKIDGNIQENKLEMIVSKLDFDIKGFIQDLTDLTENEKNIQDFQLKLKKYIGKNCPIEFLTPNEGLLLESKNQASQTEKPEEKKDFEEASFPITLVNQEELSIMANQETVTSCLNGIYNQAINKVKQIKKKIKKNDIIPQEINNQVLISNSLNALYNNAIQQQKKKKPIKTHNLEKKVAENCLESLYKDVCSNPSLRKSPMLDLKSIIFHEIDLFDRFDKVIQGSLSLLEENAVWLYFKTKSQGF